MSETPKLMLKMTKPSGCSKILRQCFKLLHQGCQLGVWNTQVFQQLLGGSLRWAAGDAKADVTPNLGAATPQLTGH